MAYGQKLIKLRILYLLELLKLVKKKSLFFHFSVPRLRYGHILVLKITIEKSKFFLKVGAF